MKADQERLLTEMGLLEAVAMARKSQDPSTQCGVSIWSSTGAPVSRGYNMPVAVGNDAAYRHGRDIKYEHIEHAEKSAIYEAARRGRPLAGATMFSTWAACPECAKAIILSGISKVVTLDRTYEDTPGRWADLVDRGVLMLRGSGVDVILWDGELSKPGEEVSIRFNRANLTL